MTDNGLSFGSREAHRTWVAAQAALPRGFRVACTPLTFTAVETGAPTRMRLNLIVLDESTTCFSAVFTRNAFPGAPILLGREVVQQGRLAAIAINNKVSNVCAPEGIAASRRVQSAVATAVGCPATAVLPSSTGVIGWRLPAEDLVAAVPAAMDGLQADSILPVAEGIMTTDLYPKVRRRDLAGGSIVGIAKGAGMIEPNLATMLVYILTDLAVPRKILEARFRTAVDGSFNRISIDSDQSTSDTVVIASSGRVPCTDHAAFGESLDAVCRELAEDVVRNGEGVHHVVRVIVTNAPDDATARGTGKAVINSPLWQCAVAGNDPNIGRLVCAVGKYLGSLPESSLDLTACRMRIGPLEVFADGRFHLDPQRERQLSAYFLAAELYATAPAVDGLTFRPPIDYPPHERRVEIIIDLGCGTATATVIGGDRTHEYITENADYRS